MTWKRNRKEVLSQTDAKKEYLPENYLPVEADFVWKRDKKEANTKDTEEIGDELGWFEQGFWKAAWKSFVKKHSAVFGLVMILFLGMMAFLGPGMNHYTYANQNLSQKNLAPRVAFLEKTGLLNGDERVEIAGEVYVVNGYQENGLDGVYYWFGSDGFGRDIWTRTWAGARTSLIIALAAAGIDMAIGVSYGMISGYFGGRTDMVMQRFLELVHGIPRLVIVTLLLLVLRPGMAAIIFALVLTEWVGMSRIARAEVLRWKEQEFILASRTLGAGSFRIIFREILPNSIGPILTQVMLSVPGAIFTETFLSFVGLGIPVPQCSLGTMIAEGFASFTLHPYQMVWPAAVMVLFMLGFYLTADGIKEALEPKIRER